MKEKDLEIKSFIKACMNDTVTYEENFKWYKKCLEKAKDTDEFYKLYFETNNVNVINSQAYGRLLKELSVYFNGYDKYISNIICKSDSSGSASSDRGSLKIGNSNCSFYIPNGYGDGETHWAIFRKDNEYRKAIDHLMNYVCSIEGKTAIYDYDCGDSIKFQLEGSFHVYSFEGRVVFVEAGNGE